MKKEITDDLNQLAIENKLSSLEKPKGIHMSHVPFSVEDDTLTPTFKLKRHQAAKKYQEVIDAMYVKIVAAENARDAANAAK